MTPRDPIGGSPLSFLLDPPRLSANGRAIARTGRPAPLAAGTTAVLWGVSRAIFATSPLWLWLGYRRGKR